MNILNLAGLTTVLIGTLIAFINSPLNSHKIDGGNFLTDDNKEQKENDKKNCLMKFGIYIL